MKIIPIVPRYVAKENPSIYAQKYRSSKYICSSPYAKAPVKGWRARYLNDKPLSAAVQLRMTDLKRQKRRFKVDQWYYKGQKYRNQSYNRHLTIIKRQRKVAYKHHWQPVAVGPYNFGRGARKNDLSESVAEIAQFRYNISVDNVQGEDGKTHPYRVVWFEDKEDAMIFRLSLK